MVWGASGREGGRNVRRLMIALCGTIGYQLLRRHCPKTSLCMPCVEGWPGGRKASWGGLDDQLGAWMASWGSGEQLSGTSVQ